MVAESETLTPEQLSDEAIMLQIRMREGIELSKLSADQILRIEPYSQSGHLDHQHWANGILQLTPTGRLIADRIVRELVV